MPKVLKKSSHAKKIDQNGDVRKATPKIKKKKIVEEEEPEEMEDAAGEASSDEEFESTAQHKGDLAKIKDKDPEFYKFLLEQDADLLEFNESDEEPEEEEEEDEVEQDEEEDDAEKTGRRKKPAIRKDNTTGRKIFDRAWYGYLEEEFADDDFHHKSVRLAVAAFSACVARTGADMDAPQWVINDQRVFDATVRLCFSQLGAAIVKLLGKQTESASVEDDDDDSKHSKVRFANWQRYNKLAKEYLSAILMFLNEVQAQAVVVSTLKTIIPLLPLYVHFSKVERLLIRGVIRIWTRKTMDCRLVAFVVLSKIVEQNSAVFATAYKSMYLGFVSNARCVTSETWPLLQFMQRSFAEITAIRPDIAYQYAFTYIRQMAIHIRNAQIGKKRKDLVQTVYNWQLVQCLFLWARVIGKAQNVEGAEIIAELNYPLVQVVIATLKLFPSIRFLPLRFHCLSILIQLQANCDVFIPVMSLSCELLTDLATLTTRKPKLGKGTVKQTDLDCQLRASAQQIEDAGWRQAASDALFRILLQAAHLIASQPAFPDVMLPVIHKIRVFCKKCKNHDFVRLFRSLQEKLAEHSAWVVQQLQGKSIDLKETTTLMQAKKALSDRESPVAKYYVQFTRVWKAKAAALQRNDSIARRRDAKQTPTAKEQPKEEVEDVDAKPETKPTQKPLRRSKKAKKAKPDATIIDSVTDLNVDEMEWSD